MTSKEELITQHIREYESRLKHLDELYERADKATAHLDEEHHSRSELEDLATEKQKLEQKAEEIKTMSLAHWREDSIHQAGPMGIWDILAQKLENFLERHE